MAAMGEKKEDDEQENGHAANDGQSALNSPLRAAGFIPAGRGRTGGDQPRRSPTPWLGHYW